jgi:hypothetical protein
VALSAVGSVAPQPLTGLNDTHGRQGTLSALAINSAATRLAGAAAGAVLRPLAWHWRERGPRRRYAATPAARYGRAGGPGCAACCHAAAAALPASASGWLMAAMPVAAGYYVAVDSALAAVQGTSLCFRTTHYYSTDYRTRSS